MRTHQRHLGRVEGRHLLGLAGVTLVVISAAVGFGLVQNPAAEKPAVGPANAPAWQTGAVLCRQDPMAHVPHPTRFLVVANCSAVSGTVRQVRRDPVDGELNIMVAPDQPYSRFLLYGNQGLLRAAVVPRDVPTVTVPKVGQHATFYGTWVLDRNQRNQAAMHPVWKVKGSGAGLVSRSTPATERQMATARPLWVHMWMPKSVPIGGSINVLVKVESGTKGARRRLPGANLFFEVRTQAGHGVQWKAATTNALGLARVTLVALEHPGALRLWLYADKVGGSAVISAPVTVRRR